MRAYREAMGVAMGLKAVNIGFCHVEVDQNGDEVWRVDGLSSPSDADRLSNGNTLVAENTRVREFDKDGNEVWRQRMTWAVEANRY